jgi:geranylgeranyl diphosphate synthase type I
LVIGACLADGDEPLIRQLTGFGEPLGEAFQLRDLGLFGDRSSIGKSIESDIREGKRNLLYAFTIEELRGEEREFFLRRWGAGAALRAEEVERLRGLVESSGARARAEAHLEALRHRAADLLERLEAASEAKDALRALSARATERFA